MPDKQLRSMLIAEMEPLVAGWITEGDQGRLITALRVLSGRRTARAARLERLVRAALERFQDPRATMPAHDSPSIVDRVQRGDSDLPLFASSSAEDAPRGMEFLYALDRLNVATSRARVATFVIASPRLFEVECKRPSQMRMVNAFARYREISRGADRVD
jgi:hypothetical protein